MNENNNNENSSERNPVIRNDSEAGPVSENEESGISANESENTQDLVQENDNAKHSEDANENLLSGEDVSEVSTSESGNSESEDSDTGTKFQEYFNETVEDNNPKITGTLLTFIKLRSIDEELTDIEYEKGDLPDKIESINSEIASLDKKIQEKRKTLENLGAERAKLKTDNDSFEERINKYDEQKYNVRSNTEYDEIVKTIESIFEEVKKNELRLKEIEEIYTKQNSEAEILESKSNDLKTELTEKQTLLDELNEQYKTEETDLRDKRKALIDTIDTAGRNLYERINRSYKGEATAIVRKGNCSGCYNSIPPQRVIEIKSAEKIYTCQSCGRILVSEDLAASNENQ